MDVVELSLVFNFFKSLINILDFISLWDCTLVSARTLSNKATIEIPSERFKLLFGENPRVGRYKIPTGAGYFMEEEVIVKEVITR